MSRKKVRTVTVSEGEPFQLRLKGNRPLEHEGGVTSIFHPVLTEEELQLLEGELRAYGGTVKSTTTDETEEQKRIRSRRVGATPVVYACERCPSCTFLSYKGDPCGLLSFEREEVQALLQTERGVRDLGECPVRDESHVQHPDLI